MFTNTCLQFVFCYRENTVFGKQTSELMFLKKINQHKFHKEEYYNHSATGAVKTLILVRNIKVAIKDSYQGTEHDKQLWA